MTLAMLRSSPEKDRIEAAVELMAQALSQLHAARREADAERERAASTAQRALSAQRAEDAARRRSRSIVIDRGWLERYADALGALADEVGRGARRSHANEFANLIAALRTELEKQRGPLDDPLHRSRGRRAARDGPRASPRRPQRAPGRAAGAGELYRAPGPMRRPAGRLGRPSPGYTATDPRRIRICRASVSPTAFDPQSASRARHRPAVRRRRREGRHARSFGSGADRPGQRSHP